ncbi:MAG TPA: MarR family transcriptional regulator [Amycolatopsis sp.]|uniref:MarR family winged helix-turn-helix transcriptional regulator n=1 Tax=Amycolatopsis sp. TaxID=37632 RepID=UPI002B482F29|nr:MarR family transcriptional regulator [Amycolatopsis sp.]HKS45614.1 MarR family transcriptional regulator [Amycolatopsis sp.]
MGPSDEAGLELMQQLRTSGQLQNAWINQLWQKERALPHPAAAPLLVDLAKHGESRLSELARRRMVDDSVISRQIAELTAAGLVDRRPAPEDGRAALLSVSEQGYVELERMRQANAEFIRSALSNWDEDEVTVLTARLASMNDALRNLLDTHDATLCERPMPSHRSPSEACRV